MRNLTKRFAVIVAVITVIAMTFTITDFSVFAVENDNAEPQAENSIVMDENVAPIDEETSSEEVQPEEFISDDNETQTEEAVSIDKESSPKVIKTQSEALKILFVKPLIDGNAKYEWTGSAIRPEIIVKNELGEELEAGIDYTVEYEKNVKLGAAKVIVKGAGTYTGSEKERTFWIVPQKVIGLKGTGATTTSISLTWDAQKNTSRYEIAGYKIYRYYAGTNEWKWVKTVYGADNNKTTVKNLISGSGYRFKVKAYTKVGDYSYVGIASTAYLTPTRSSTATVSKVSRNPIGDVAVYWKQIRASGYVVRISSKKSFATYKEYKVTSATTLKHTFKKMNKGTYYVKVRAYKSFGGHVRYGKYSSIKSITVTKTGWYTESNGSMKYYRSGVAVSGTQILNGRTCYFDKTSHNFLGSSPTMYNKAKAATSNTNYMLILDRPTKTLVVYKKYSGKWKPCKVILTSVGMDEPEHRTPLCEVSVIEKRKYFEGSNYTCWYATRIKGTYYFHSCPYYKGSMTRVMDGRLGQEISHGCIRMRIDNAKWIYDKVPVGSKVIIYK